MHKIATTVYNQCIVPYFLSVHKINIENKHTANLYIMVNHITRKSLPNRRGYLRFQIQNALPAIGGSTALKKVTFITGLIVKHLYSTCNTIHVSWFCMCFRVYIKFTFDFVNGLTMKNTTRYSHQFLCKLVLIQLPGCKLLLVTFLPARSLFRCRENKLLHNFDIL